MTLIFKPSFERVYKKLPASEKAAVDHCVNELFDYYNKDILFAGLKVRKMSGKTNYFEIDTASNRRILIRKHNNIIEFIAYGNHDEIRRFLKNFK